jgi:hypothetical protein
MVSSAETDNQFSFIGMGHDWLLESVQEPKATGVPKLNSDDENGASIERVIPFAK